MGDAKKRGTYEQRVEAAQAKRSTINAAPLEARRIYNQMVAARKQARPSVVTGAIGHRAMMHAALAQAGVVVNPRGKQ